LLRAFAAGGPPPGRRVTHQRFVMPEGTRQREKSGIIGEMAGNKKVLATDGHG
jgi:hypothetical protein